MTTSHTSSNTMTANQLTKIVGQPTALDIANLQREIIEMAGNMSNPNSKQFGHVGMMMTDVEYQKFAKDSGHTGNVTEWSAPKESGPRPEFKKGTDKDEYRILVEAWKYNDEVEAQYTEGRKELKIQITNAVEAQFLRKVRNKTDTSHGLGPKELLDHLKSTYGVVTGREIVANRKKLDDVWDGKTPITELWERISDIRELAAYANAAISDNDCITAVLQATESIPDFADIVRKYYRTPPASWKWDVAITEFTAVDGGREFKTTGERGYHAANAATATPTKPPARRGGAERANYPKVDRHQFVSTYCHSHGWQMDRAHNSETCPDPKKGHKNEATAHNHMGGSQEVSFKRKKGPEGEKAPKK
jgi:hypothetical protein